MESIQATPAEVGFVCGQMHEYRLVPATLNTIDARLDQLYQQVHQPANACLL